MKNGIIFLTAIIAAVIAAPVNEVSKYSRFIQISGDDGVVHEVDLEADVDDNLIRRAEENGDTNAYLLYTKRNPRSAQQLTYNRDSINNSNFDASVPTVVVSHGWTGSQQSSVNAGIRDAYLEKGEANVIVLDWEELASGNYITSVAAVPGVGRNLGEFLLFLHVTTGVPLEYIHLAGYSLGAHVVGNAGRRLNGRIGRITGLDPAGPLWNLNPNTLRQTDGIYTEAIHTDGGIVGQGIGSSVADADFFPNGGNSQPGCSTSSCNHAKSWQYFAATVKLNHLYGRECANNSEITMNRCSGPLYPMGNDDVTKRGSGLYRLDTSEEYPYLLPTAIS